MKFPCQLCGLSVPPETMWVADLGVYCFRCADNKGIVPKLFARSATRGPMLVGFVKKRRKKSNNVSVKGRKLS